MLTRIGIMSTTTRKGLPPSLRRLCLFYSDSRPSHQGLANSLDDSIDSSLATLVRATRTMQSVALTGIVDASRFCRAAEFERRATLTTQTTQTRQRQEPSLCFWPDLTTIVLTDYGLSPSNPDVHMILEAAAHMALDMPNLQTMELWNPREPCLFRYEASPSRPKITMKGVWFLPRAWTTQCRKMWHTVAANYTATKYAEECPGVVVQASFERLPANASQKKKRHIFILRHLKLRNEIVDPVSRYEMECDDLFLAIGEKRPHHEWVL